jgi:hypothetical protein
MMNDEALIDVFGRMARDHGCSADDILETPELREEFLRQTRRVLGDLPERQLLHRLIYLRKRCKLPRSREAASA